MTDDSPARARFEHLFALAYDDLCRFVRRRIDDGDDVVADTFLVAWRRLGDVPADDGEARAWLFGTARKLMANRRRKDARVVAWAGVGTGGPPGEPTTADPTSAVDARVDLGRAFATLAGTDQECLALVAWDGLSATQAAAVLDISPNAFTVRLHRARQRLRAALAEPQTLAALATLTPRTNGSPS